MTINNINSQLPKVTICVPVRNGARTIHVYTVDLAPERPCGEDAFIQKIEKILGRKLEIKKAGRKHKT